MRSRAVLVNTARGPLVDTAALVNALGAGRLLGAGLDVTDPEPLPVGHPLFGLPNAVLTPHTGYASDRTLAAMTGTAVANLADGSAGRRPRFLANPAAWNRDLCLNLDLFKSSRLRHTCAAIRPGTPLPLQWNANSMDVRQAAEAAVATCILKAPFQNRVGPW